MPELVRIQDLKAEEVTELLSSKLACLSAEQPAAAEASMRHVANIKMACDAWEALGRIDRAA